jgi:outer membrane protein assembly factor BamB
MALDMTAAWAARQGYTARRCLAVGVAALGLWVCASAGAAATEPDNEHTGFTVPQADEDFTTTLSDFHRYSAKGEWEKALRCLSELHETDPGQLSRGEDGLVVPVRRRIWEAVVSLPPEGRRAFDVFFSGQASELAGRMLAPEARASGEDVALAGEVYDRYFISEYGVAAADLLGDAAFERGRFNDAAVYWRAILDHPNDAEIPEARVAVKLAVALHRAGLADEYEKQRGLVSRRYADRSVVLGGQTLTAASALDMLSDPSSAAASASQPADPARVSSAAAPGDEAQPLWQVRFMSGSAQSSLKSALSNWWGPASGLTGLVPANTTDGGRIYCNWLGICFAIDAQTGKLLWRTDKFNTLNGKFQQFQNGSAVASRYEIAAAGDTVLTVSLPLDRLNYYREAYRLTALDAATGEKRWDSTDIDSLKEMTFIGRPLVLNDQVLAVCHSKEGADAQLKAISLQDGQEAWGLPLGQAVMTTTRNGRQRVPEPTLMLDGDLLYVLTNNGALLVIDLPQRRITWAMSYPPPPGTGNQQNNVFWGGPSDAGKVYTRGVVRRYGGVLYFKESGSPTLYALDPVKRKILWKRPVSAEAKIVGIDPGRVYLLGRELLSIDRRTRGLKWSTKLPIGAGGLRVIHDGQRVTVLTGRGVYEIDKTNGDILRIFRGHDLASQGGSVDLRDGTMVCTSNLALSAYRPGDAPGEAPDETAPGNTQASGS